MPSVFDNPKAFAPFYDQIVAVKGDVQSGTFKACVFEGGSDDPLAEASMGVDRRSITVIVPKFGEGGWNNVRPPAIGDLVTILSWGGVEGVDDFRIQSAANDNGDAWLVTAREFKP